jgi:hypothetical protein
MTGSSNPRHGDTPSQLTTASKYQLRYCSKVDSIQHYVVQFASELGHVSGFLRVLQFPQPIKPTATI